MNSTMKQWIISGVIGAAAYAALIWVFALLTGQDYSGWMVIIYAWVPFLCREELPCRRVPAPTTGQLPQTGQDPSVSPPRKQLREPAPASFSPAEQHAVHPAISPVHTAG